MNVPENVFAAVFIAESTLPFAAAIRAGAFPALSNARMPLHRFPTGEIAGGVDQVTFSCAAAWIASNSFGATTPRKLPTCTIWTFAR